MIWRRRNKLGKWGVLTIRFRGEEYLFRQSRGRDDVKLVEKMSKASSFAIIGQAQVEISSFASRAQKVEIKLKKSRSISKKEIEISTFRHAPHRFCPLHHPPPLTISFTN